MLVAINANEANVVNPVGSNVFALEIIRALEKLDRKNHYQIYLKKPPLPALPARRRHWDYTVFGPGRLWTQWALSIQTFRDKPDVLFSPGHYGATVSYCPQIVSVMDLAFWHYPAEFRPKDLWQLRLWTKRSVTNARKVIAISESTKRDLMKYYQLHEGKITVVYPGIPSQAIFNFQFSISNQFQISKKFQISKHKFLLFLGTLQPRKNIINLILAYQAIAKTDPDLCLVVTGKKGWLYDAIFRLAEKECLEDKVIFTGFVSEEEKAGLLAQAEGLVLPSLYEGFGFPILEAFRARCPVVCSRNSSLPEVAGKAAVYIENENDPASIATAVKKMLQLKHGQKEKLITEGQKQLTKFSWSKAALQITKIFEEIVN